MSGQQYQQLLQQSPYYSQVQNSPYVQPFQLPTQPNTWGQMARAGFQAPIQIGPQQALLAQMRAASSKGMKTDSDGRTSGAPARYPTEQVR